jgi:ubiquinone biosynthesis protein UbiJ
LLPDYRKPLAMNALPSPLAAPIVAALNHLIEQEPWACALLSPFAGRVIRFDAAAFALALKVTEHGCIEQATVAEAPAVTLLVPLQQWPLVVADVAEGRPPRCAMCGSKATRNWPTPCPRWPAACAGTPPKTCRARCAA